MRQTIIVLIAALLAFSAGANETADILKKAANGNLKALNQAFALLPGAGAADSEEIGSAIGESVRRNSKNFLTALKANRSKIHSLGEVLGNLPHDLDDQPKKQKAELKARLDAIILVKDESFKSLREECEAELKLEINGIPSE